MNTPYVFRRLRISDWQKIDHTHWQHTQEYARFAQALNREVTQIGMYHSSSDMLCGYMQIVHYPLGHGFVIADIPYGPVWIESPSDALKHALADFLHKYAHAHQLFAIRLELQDSHPRFRSAYFSNNTSFAQAQGEAVLDLSPTLDDLFAQCSKSTRRNIKKSQRNTLQIEFAHGQDMLEYRDDFIHLNEATTQEHHTTTHTPSHFHTLFEVLAQNEDNFVAVVRDAQSTIHAINIMTVFNSRAYCPYGASTSEGKRTLGAYYFIKWEIIRYLKEHDVREFNWGGIAVGADDAALSGLNQFKLGFGGEIVEHAPRYDLPASWWYYLYILRSLVKHYLK